MIDLCSGHRCLLLRCEIILPGIGVLWLMAAVETAAGGMETAVGAAEAAVTAVASGGAAHGRRADAVGRVPRPVPDRRAEGVVAGLPVPPDPVGLRHGSGATDVPARFERQWQPAPGPECYCQRPESDTVSVR